MANTYSLVVFGGLTGKSTDLMQYGDLSIVRIYWEWTLDGTRVQFKQNSDVLPTGLSHDVVYYIKNMNPVEQGKFYLCTDAALTNQVVISGTHSGAHVLQSPLVANPSVELAPYGLSDLTRWGTHIYDGLISWVAGKAASTTYYDDEVCELGGAFREAAYSNNALVVGSYFKSATLIVHSKINSIRTDAFHNGILGTGYIYQQDLSNSSNTAFEIPIASYDRTIDGFSIFATGDTSGLKMGGIPKAKNLFIVNIGTKSSNYNSYAVRPNAHRIHLENCVTIGFNNSFPADDYTYGNKVFNNVFAKPSSYGVTVSGPGATYGFFYNNICIGAGVADFQTVASLRESCSGNRCAVGTPWTTSGGTSGTIATTDFVNYTNDDYRPASILSQQVATGVTYAGMGVSDITDAATPAYPGALVNTTITAGSFVAGMRYTITTLGDTDWVALGAASATVGVTFKSGGIGAGTGTATFVSGYDAGPYQFDLGYGPWPASTTVTFAGVKAGTEIRVYDSTGVELAGVETCAADNPVLTWILPVGDVRIVTVNTTYKLKEITYTSVEGAVTLPVQQELDRWYSNPI